MSEGAEPGEEVVMGADVSSDGDRAIITVHRRDKVNGVVYLLNMMEAYPEAMRASHNRRAARDEARHRADEARWRHGPHHPLPRLIRRAGRDRIPK